MCLNNPSASSSTSSLRSMPTNPTDPLPQIHIKLEKTQSPSGTMTLSDGGSSSKGGDGVNSYLFHGVKPKEYPYLKAVKGGKDAFQCPKCKKKYGCWGVYKKHYALHLGVV